MERGVTMLVRILLGAVLLGGLVIAFHPDYRETFMAMLGREVEQSPIWQSNAGYYEDVGYELPVEGRRAE